jgi:hypothetical protein
MSETLQLYLTEKLREIDLSLLALRDELETQLKAGKVDKTKTDSVFYKYVSRIPEADSFRATDRNGIVLYGTAIPETDTPVSIEDRDYFLRLRNNHEHDMIFSKPVLGKISNKMVIIFAMSYRNPDGSFAGVVYAPVRVSFITDRFASLKIGKNDIIALFDENRDIYARYRNNTDTDLSSKPTVSLPATITFINSKQEKLFYRSYLSLDSVERFFAFRKIPRYNLYIVSGLSTRNYFIPWLKNALLIAVPALFLINLSFFLVQYIRSTWKNLETANNSLQEALTNIKTLSGLLPICASCKKIRDDNGYWNQIELYIKDHSDVNFSHSLCPDCAKKMYPEIYKSG